MTEITVTVRRIEGNGWRVDVSRYPGELPFVVYVGTEAEALALQASYVTGAGATLDRPPRVREPKP